MGRYLIVAAGHFRADGTPIAPTYNNLIVTPEPVANEYIIKFGEGTGKADTRYVNPTPEDFTYIVKGTLVASQLAAGANFNVIEFKRDGIRIRVGNAAPRPESFMIEISLFGKFEN
jgi:hypothetical protein